MRGPSGLALLASIDLPELVGRILQVFEMFSNSQVTYRAFRAIPAQAAHLFRCLLLRFPELYQSFAQKFPLKSLLLRGILCKKSLEVREFFQQQIYFLCENVRNTAVGIEKNPLGDFLSTIMLDMKASFNSEEECGELCEVLISGLETYHKLDTSLVPETGVLFDPTEKLKDALETLREYKSKESALESAEPNKGLVGLLKISDKLVGMLEYQCDLPVPLRLEWIQELLFRCLFPLRAADVNKFKCKAEVSRVCAFKLLESVTGFDAQCIAFILRECFMLIPGKVVEPTVWGYNPERDKKSTTGYVGLRNLGCICYMISMIQQFFMITPFRNALVSVPVNDPPKLDNPFGIDDNMLRQFQHIFCYLQGSSRQDCNPYKFCYAFKGTDGKPTNTAIQQDAHEFLNIFFDRLERKLRETQHKLLLQSVFGGKLCNQLICKACGKVKNNYEDMYSLSLEIKNQRTLGEAIEKFISGSLVSGYFCEGCKAKVEVVKRTLFASLPNVLIIHLQRFTYNFDLGMNEKVSQR